jgi:hypothetical protein
MEELPIEIDDLVTIIGEQAIKIRLLQQDKQQLQRDLEMVTERLKFTNGGNAVTATPEEPKGEEEKLEAPKPDDEDIGVDEADIDGKHEDSDESESDEIVKRYGDVGDLSEPEIETETETETETKGDDGDSTPDQAP